MDVVNDPTDAIKLVQVRWLFHDVDGYQLTEPIARRRVGVSP